MNGVLKRFRVSDCIDLNAEVAPEFRFWACYFDCRRSHNLLFQVLKLTPSVTEP